MNASRPKILLANDTALLGHHGSALVVRQLCRLLKAAGMDLVTGHGWARIEAEGLSGQWEGVVVNGEGSIHDDSRTARRIAALGRQCAASGTAAWLINASVHDNGPAVLEGLAAFRRVWVRDAASRRSLAGAAIAAELVPDLTLSWREAPIHRGSSGPLYITDASEDAKSKRLLALARHSGARFVSLRTVPPRAADGRANPRRRWLTAKRLAAAALPLSPWTARHAPAFGDVDALASALAAAGGLITGRYHGVCLALRTGTPFLAIAGNTTKIDDLLADAGLGHRLVTLEALETAPHRPPPFTEEETSALSALLQRAEVGAADMIATISADLAR
jgi:hypothetical protein